MPSTSGSLNGVMMSNGNGPILGPRESPSQTQSDGPSPTQTQGAFAAQQGEYGQVASTELVDSETIHLSELQTFWDSYLVPLQKTEL
jgi:hypothetical protein